MNAAAPRLKKQVVVIGGGTGTHTVLRGLRTYADRIDITAVVSMADSGGSTGRLRDEFGQLPIGDVRNALTALADSTDEYATVLRQLFLYRFDKGEGLRGHNFGNLFLTALTAILGSEMKAIQAASALLRVVGTVIPVTTEQAHLRAVYDDGVCIEGEAAIDEPPRDRYERQIVSLSMVPAVRSSAEAVAAVAAADLMIIGPGDVYTSSIPNALAEGFKDAVVTSKARLVYVCNLMSRRGQTHGMHAVEHLNEIQRYFGRRPEWMLINTTPIPPDLIAHYTQEGEHCIQNNTATETVTTVLECPLLESSPVVQGTADRVRRSLIRHDPALLAAQLVALCDR